MFVNLPNLCKLHVTLLVLILFLLLFQADVTVTRSPAQMGTKLVKLMRERGISAS